MNLLASISMSVVVAGGGSVDDLSRSVSYLHKAGRTAGTLRPGARYRPLWLRSLQKGGKESQQESLLGVSSVAIDSHTEPRPSAQAAAALPRSGASLEAEPWKL